MGALLTSLGFDWWAEPGPKAGPPALSEKIAQFEHDATLAKLQAADCLHEAKDLFATDPACARQRFAHAQSFKAQHLSLMKAVTTMHAQRVSIAAHEANVRILATLKDTARLQHHNSIDPDLVDRITEKLNDANDNAVVNNGVMANLGDELAPMQDDDWDAFVLAQRPARADAGEPAEPNPMVFPATPSTVPSVNRQATVVACARCGEVNCTCGSPEALLVM
jgi:hypothetical protein